MEWSSILNMVSYLTGISGMILGLIGFLTSRSSTVKDFYKEDAEQRVSDARWKVYQLGKEKSEIVANDKEKAIVCSHYEYFAKLHKKMYIPLWAFSDSDEFAVITCYKKLEPYILERRVENPYYAINFEWLYQRLIKNKKIREKISKNFHVKKEQ